MPADAALSRENPKEGAMGFATHEIRMIKKIDGQRRLLFAWRGPASDAGRALAQALAARDATWSAWAHARTGRTLPLPSDLEPDDLTATAPDSLVSGTVTWTPGDVMRDAAAALTAEGEEPPTPATDAINLMGRALAATSPSVRAGLRAGSRLILTTSEFGSTRDMLICDAYIADGKGRVIAVPAESMGAHAVALDAVAALATWLKAKGIAFRTGVSRPLQIVEAMPQSATLCAVERPRMLARAADALPDALALLRAIGAGRQADAVEREALR